MTEPIPAGHDGLIPHLCCSPCVEAMKFYERAFGAIEVWRVPAPDGRIMHASMNMNGHMLFLVDDFPDYCGGKSENAIALGGSPVTIHRYVENCDEAFEQAIQAGATPLMPPADMFWGDRYSMVKDPFGHKWSLATHIQDLTNDQIQEAMKVAFSQPPA